MATGDLHVDIMSQKEIARKLEQLDKIGKKAWRKVASRVIPPAVARAKAAAPEQTGLLKRAITGKVTFSGNVRIFVDPKVFAARRDGEWRRVVLKGKSNRLSWAQKGALGKLKRPSKYAHVVEFGRKKKRPIPAHPFLLGAFRGQEAQILNQTVREFDVEMAKLTQGTK